MRLKFSSGLFYLFSLAVFIYSCANRVAPTGGDKDVKPPVLVEYTPANYSTNLKAKKIIIEFDEFIQLKDINSQLVISPLMNPEPKIVFKKRILEIQLPDTLRPNTTYTLNFGNAVADLNEGNSITDFQYVFSTGDVLDSLFCSGKVTDAYSHKSEKGITVMLYTDHEDSLPFKNLPDYFARTDEQGHYKIKNISPGTYKLFALNDKNNNYRCDNPQDEAIAFADEFVQVPDSMEETLQLFYQRPSKLFVKKATKENNGPVIISFNQPAEDLSWQFLNEKTIKNIPHLISTGFDSLFFWVADTTIDSLKLVLLNKQIAFDTVAVKMMKRKSSFSDRGDGNRNIFSYNSNVLSGILKPTDTLMISFQNPLLKASLNQIILTGDTLPITKFKIGFSDSLHRHVYIVTSWKEEIKYNLFIPPGALADVYGNISDSILFNFIQAPVSDFGTLKTLVTGIKSKNNYQLQLVNESLQIIQQVDFDQPGNYTFENISPGSYKVRLLNDLNKNMKWDNGDYWKKVQPEVFLYYPEPVQIRANWELEINIDQKK